MSDDAARDDGGEFGRKVTDEEIITAIRRTNTPVVTASELAEELPIGRRAVRERLLALKDQDIVERKDVGARAVVWWLTTPQETTAPAAPLQNLVGLVDEETAARARERSQEWREEFNEEMEIGDT